MKKGLIHRNPNMDHVGNQILIRQQTEYTPEQIMQSIDSMSSRPLISIIMEVNQPSMEWMKRTVASIQQQYYPNWELCIAQGERQNRRAYLRLERMGRQDGRIKVAENLTGQTGNVWNDSLAMCQGEYTVIVRQYDELTKDALFWIAKVVNENPHCDFLYSDECRMTNQDTYLGSDFLFKPDWSPALLINYLYTGHLAAYRTEKIREIGGFRDEYQVSQEYDLVLRLSDSIKNVRHIERVLYYERVMEGLEAAVDQEKVERENGQAITDWYRQKGFEVSVTHAYGGNEVQILNKRNEKVSIIIPTDSFDNLKRSIDGIINHTQYRNIEIIAVTNSKLLAKMQRFYVHEQVVRFCPYDRPFNFSDKCNQGAMVATGDFLVFFNDDVIPEKRDWIERLLDVAYLPNVGAVSPLLFYQNDTIQYAGMITGTPGMIGTSFHAMNRNQPVQNRIHHQLIRNVSVLSGACTMIQKSIFMRVGMFDAIHTPNGHSDVDLCFRLLENQYECVYTPYSILTHIGNHSWEAKSHVDKADIFLLKRWGPYLERDGYFTDRMKSLLVADLPYPYKIYAPRQIQLGNESGKDILFVTHELSRTGAPVVLQDFIKLVLKRGHFPVVLAHEDGPLRQEYYEMGVTVIVDNGNRYGGYNFEHFARNFDLVVANTLVCANAVEQLANSLPKVLWWIHEGTYALNAFQNFLPKRYGSNIFIYCGGEYSKEIVQSRIGRKIGVLNYGVEDVATGREGVRVQDGLAFVIPASYERRKGQDIMVSAIKLLSEEEKSKIKFIFLGNVAETDIFNQVQDLALRCKNVQIMNPISRAELFDLYDNVTGVIMASRDDPMPVVLAEAMMKRKICICSLNTGTSRYIKNWYNGFVFNTEDYTALANILKRIIYNPGILPGIAENGRKVYEAHFSSTIFESNVSRIVDMI